MFIQLSICLLLHYRWQSSLFQESVRPANPKIFYCLAIYRRSLSTADLELLFVYVSQGVFVCWGAGGMSASLSLPASPILTRQTYESLLPNVLHSLDLCGQRKRLKTVVVMFSIIITVPVFWYFVFENLIKYNLICLVTDFLL